MHLVRSIVKQPARLRENVLWDAFPVQIRDSQVVLGFGQPLIGCGAIPPGGFGGVSGDPRAFGVRDTKLVLAWSISLFGGGSKPAEGFSKVLRDADAPLLANPKAPLSYGISIAGTEADYLTRQCRYAIPLSRTSLSRKVLNPSALVNESVL